MLFRSGNDRPVRDNVIHIAGAHRTGVTEVIDLYGARPHRKNIGAVDAEITVQIDENVDLAPAHKVGDLTMRLELSREAVQRLRGGVPLATGRSTR